LEFAHRLGEYVKLVNKEIKEYLEKEKERFSELGEIGLDSYNKIYDFCMRGGKRIRPVLVIVGYEAVGGDELEKILKVAPYAEFLHDYLLIQDDIMDKDEKRRGGYAIHKWYENDFKWYEDAEHLGRSLAIIDSDILGSISQKVILDSDFPDELKIKALKEILETIFYTGLGQKLDVMSTAVPITQDLVYKTHSLKTSEYTFSRPLRVGGIFGKADEKQLKAFSEFGYYCGLAFQLKDDELGLNSEISKRRTKSDISEGKKTIIILRALEELDGDEKRTLESCLGSDNEEDVKTALELIKKTNAIDYNKALYEEFAKKAVQVLENAPLKRESIEFLISLAKFVINRNR